MYCHEVKELDICISDTKYLCKVQIDVAKVFNVCVCKGVHYKNISIGLAFNLCLKRRVKRCKRDYNTFTKTMLSISINKISGLYVFNQGLNKGYVNLFTGFTQVLELQSNTHKFKSKWKPCGYLLVDRVLVLVNPTT